MNKTTFFKLSVLVLTIALFTALSLTGCDNGNDNNDGNNNGNNSNTATPHQTTITAFGKTATVIGDAALSTADFNTAKGKLEDALVWADSLGGGITSEEQNGFAIIMSRTITIVIGNVAPASVNGALTVGVDYLKSSTQVIIVNTICDLIVANAFANLTIIDNTNGLAFAGSVTIKSDDTYTPADWDAVVQKVIAALNRGYSDSTTGNVVVFGDVFNASDYRDGVIEVIVLKSASHNIEVKSGEYGKLYLKESSLDTLSASTVKDAVWTMSDGLNDVDGEYQA